MNPTSLTRKFTIPIALFLSVGCGRQEKLIPERRPRPVATAVLSQRLPPNAALVTASTGTWKSEQLGFEVAGRIEFVAEQNTAIDGRIRDAEGKLIVEGTPIARVESERYQLAVANAEASVARAEQDLIVGRNDLKETIPAQIDAANASLELAKVEYDRSRQLGRQNAISQSELDRAKSTYENAVARLRQLVASEKSQQAQIASLESALLQAKQGLRDAQRDLEDCTLYSSFQGVISDASVVPGSLVSAGTPVVTLQMMDPIKVELEVSGEQSRRLQRTETLPVHVTLPDGRIEIQDGFLDQIDPSADPQTRTFTLTILVLNKKLTNVDSTRVATTRDIWRLDLEFIPGAGSGDLFVEEKAILYDADGAYLWQITNATVDSGLPVDQVFKVRKIRVKPSDAKVPFLGVLVFQKVMVLDEQFDPLRDIIIGELQVPRGQPNQWNGEEVLLDSPSRWMLRPGDLVKVDLSSRDRAPGYYVPMDAISRHGDETSLFVVDSTGNQPVVRRLPVSLASKTLDSTTSSLRRVEPIGEVSLDGVQYVTRGTHFLIDGERVTIVPDPLIDKATIGTEATQ